MAGIQFTGLSSGIDTDSIVQAMLTTYQSRIDNANNDKQVLQWKQEKWSSINDSINKFYSNYVDKLRYDSTFQSYSATINSNAITIKSTGDTAVGRHTLEVDKLAKQASYVGTMDLSAINKEDGTDVKNTSFEKLGMLTEGEEVKLKVGENGTEVTISSTDTIASLEKKLKAADSSLNINFDTDNNKLFISSKETGESAQINITAEGNETFLNQLGLGQSISETGSNASYKYNGMEGFTSESNTISINGMSIQLHEENTGLITIDIGQDSESTIEFISGFVDAYNELIDTLNTAYNATKISTKPLTDDEKANMTEKQIDEYEKNIKDSLLRRDSSLKQVIDTLRSSMQTVVAGNKYGSLSAIGITTGNYSENGKLTLDTEKLRKALAEDPDAVKDLFTSKVEGAQGIGTKLNNNVQNLSKRVEGLKSYQSYYNDKVYQDKVTSMTDRITALKSKYTKMETLYYKKFTAMEKALSTLNSQSSSFLSMLG